MAKEADAPFAYDVFVSHSSKDKPVVRDVAEGLRNAGRKVWLTSQAIGSAAYVVEGVV
jgi:hypothetical protein